MSAYDAGNPGCSGVGIVAKALVGANFTANNLYLVTVMSDSSQSFGTLTGTGGETWVALSQIGNSTRKLQVYRCMPTSNITTTVTAGFSFGNYPNMVDLRIYEIANVQTGANGANAIVQVVSDSATGADPTITMAALGQRNGVIALFSNNTNPFGGTAESGWSENIDTGCETYVGSAYTNGNYIMTRINGTDNTPQVTKTSSTWLGTSIELRQSGRRITLIN